MPASAREVELAPSQVYVLRHARQQVEGLQQMAERRMREALLLVCEELGLEVDDVIVARDGTSIRVKCDE